MTHKCSLELREAVARAGVSAAFCVLYWCPCSWPAPDPALRSRTSRRAFWSRPSRAWRTSAPSPSRRAPPAPRAPPGCWAAWPAQNLASITLPRNYNIEKESTAPNRVPTPTPITFLLSNLFMFKVLLCSDTSILNHRKKLNNFGNYMRTTSNYTAISSFFLIKYTICLRRKLFPWAENALVEHLKHFKTREQSFQWTEFEYIWKPIPTGNCLKGLLILDVFSQVLITLKSIIFAGPDARYKWNDTPGNAKTRIKKVSFLHPFYTLFDAFKEANCITTEPRMRRYKWNLPFRTYNIYRVRVSLVPALRGSLYGGGGGRK